MPFKLSTFTMSTTSTTPGSDAFLNSLLSMVNQEDLIAILNAQTQMLDRFEKTNEMLSNFNRLSSRRYEKTFEQFKEHTETLLKMKKDLDVVFRRIRTLKKKLATDYPHAFVAALEDIIPPDLDEEEEGKKKMRSCSPSHRTPNHPAPHPSPLPPAHSHPARSPHQQEQQFPHHHHHSQHHQQPETNREMNVSGSDSFGPEDSPTNQPQEAT